MAPDQQPDPEPDPGALPRPGRETELADVAATADGETPVADMETLLALADEHVHAARAENTHRAYASDWVQFTGWCAARRRTALPATPRTVVLYLTSEAKRLRVSTLQRRLAAIGACHKATGHPSPTGDATVRAVWRGIVRTQGRRPTESAPVGTDTIRQVLAVLGGDGPADTRDRAILLLCYAGAFRRSELVGVDVEHVEHVPEGIIVNLARSKTDQEGRGRRIGIPNGTHPDTDPVAAYRAWLAVSGITTGAVFRPVDKHGTIRDERLRGQAVSIVLKRAARRAGLNPELFSSHSLRSGHVIQAARAGADEAAIMAQTGHRSVIMPRRYIREGTLFSENSAAALGL